MFQTRLVLNYQTLTPASIFQVRCFSSSFIQKQGDLFKFQKDLPALPVPSLKHTLDLYKQSIVPLYQNGVNSLEYQKYCKAIEQFALTEGPKLQSRLLEYSNGKRNWMTEMWNDYAYLDYRDPVSPFVSYFYSHKELNTAIGKNQLLKASAIVYQVLQFMTAIENETLSPELIKGVPFCMESFKSMFNTCRIPHAKRDLTMKFNPGDNRFLVVISNGRFYKLYHHEKDGSIVSLGKIYNGLKRIHSISHTIPPPLFPIGILTSSNRDAWAENYKLLESIPTNKGTLKEIESSSFVLCLDDNYPITIEEKSKNCWYGNGFNRWFDKPVEMFVTKNGSSGFLGEHSMMDGTPTLSMNDWIMKQISQMKITDFNNTPSAAKVSELPTEINPQLQNAIRTELQAFKSTTNSLDIKVWQFHGLGKDQIKKFKVSPDAFMQLLLQLAYYKYTGTLRPTYESASTRKFFNGRTETCRSVTSESLQFVKDWEDTSKSVDEKMESFKRAIGAHIQFVRQASAGLGVDRHFLGLSMMIKPNEVKPEIFTDPMFAYSQHWYLSTSQLTSEEFNGYGWAPVVPEGFGLAYMLNKNWCHVNITVHKDNPLGLKADAMAAYLTQSVLELKEVLSK